MAEDEKAAGGPPSQIIIINTELLMQLLGKTVEDDPQSISWAFQPDGSARIWGLQIGRDETGREQVFLTEVTGEQAMVVKGEDPSGDLRRLRVDENRLLRNRPFEAIRPDEVALMPAASAPLFTSPAGQRTKVFVEINANSAVAAVVDLWVKPTGGADADVNQVLDTVPIPAGGIPLRLGHYHLDPGGIISGTSVPADSASIRFVPEAYTGDALSTP